MSTDDPPIPFGRFELLGVMAAGGTGRVWRARHKRNKQSVAVKIVDPDRLEEIGGIAGFRRSVQAQARLRHPGVASIFDYGVVPAESLAADEPRLKQGAPYLVMELATRGTLAETVLPSDFGWCREILLAILRSLGHAHARGVLHRDLKPANILRFPDNRRLGRWKLTDFGFALQMDDLDLTAVPGADATAGTPLYMAPEQLEGSWRQFGAWTDLYQVGCIAYELVCGAPPHRGETFAEVAAGHLYRDLPALDPRFDVPDGLETWIHRLMTKKPAGRFRRAADAARRLEEVAPPGSTPTPNPDPETPVDIVMEERRPMLILRPPLAPTPAPDAPAPPEAVERPASAWGLPTPLPDSSQMPDLGADLVPFPDVGLSLFGLRDRPLVDRHTERGRLWSTLSEVVDGRTARGLILEGPEGAGKSRLARWLSRRSHELGICEVFETTADPTAGASEGLAGMIERWLHAVRADREACARLLADRLDAYPSGDSGPRDCERDLVAGLTELLRPADRDDEKGPHYTIDSAEERFILVERLFEQIARRRPVLVWADDLEQSHELAAFLDWHFTLDDPAPLLALATTTTEAAEPARLETLGGRDAVGRLAVEPLSASAQYELVDSLLPMPARVVDQVVERSEGNALFAVQLVDDWADRGLLAPTDEGFDFQDAAPPPLPRSLYELWMRRLAAATDALPAVERPAAMAALELAATLGRHFDGAELRSALHHADLPYPERLLERSLVDRGLVERDRDQWHFSHRLLAESLEEHARRNGRLRDHHRACAAALADRTDDHSARDHLRRATHLKHAGKLTDALAPLLDGAQLYRRDIGRFDRAAELVERHRRWMNQADVPAEDARRVENQVELAWSFLHRGQPNVAESLAEKARDAGDADLPAPVGEACLVLARIYHDRGILEDTSAYLDEAERAFRRAGQNHGLARCLRFRAQLLRRRQRLDDARQLFEDVRAQYAEMDDAVGQAWCDWGIARTWLDQNEVESADTVARRLADDADTLNLARLQVCAHNLLGEIARNRNRWDAAIDHYGAARDLLVHSGSKDRIVAELNLALAEVGARRWEQAYRDLRTLREHLEGSGLETYRAHVALGLVACAAHRQNWADFNGELDRASEALESRGYLDPDLPALARTAAERCANVGARARGRRLYRLGARIWERMDRHEDAARLRDRADALDDQPAAD